MNEWIEIIHGFTQSLQGQCGANGVAQNALQIGDFIQNMPFLCPLTFLEIRLQKLSNDAQFFTLAVFIVSAYLCRS